MTITGEWSPPDQLEEYRIVRPLGRGAMGQVYLAEDQLLARLVAIKFVAAPSPSEAARARFFVEARAIARLSHPNVVAVHRVGEVGRRPFLVSEYVRGQSLAELDKPVPWRRVLAIAIDLARGLAAAHRRGVLHRDIKPANAMMSEEGTVKLLDFGLAELLPQDDSVPAGVPVAGHPGARTLGPDPPPGHSTIDATLDPVDATLDPALGATLEASAVPGAGSVSSTTAPPRPAGARLAGTPLYMAPEIWRGEPATPRTDVYALGVLLYELCAGAPPHGEGSIAVLVTAVLSTDTPPLEGAVNGIEPRFGAIIDRCLRREAALRFSDGDALREALEQIAAPAGVRAAIPEGNPYRGLLAFEADHRDLFFGRSAEILGILDRLRAEPFVVVAGDSGTGKSSLCRAGVLPAVAAAALGPATTVVSATLGRHPLAAIAAALAPLVGGDELRTAERLRAEPASLAREIRGRDGDVLIFIDQLEELWTLAAPDEAAAVAEALHALADRVGGVRLLATARSDFLTRLSALPCLGDDLPAALYLLRPLTAERLREAVLGPAAVKGVSFESDVVVDTLVREALHADGGLPLLQFALAELWDARDETRRIIPASALEKIGGVTGALARHADGVLAGLLPQHRPVARAILLALVTEEGTRAHHSEAELLAAAGASPDASAALNGLVRGRLLVARESESGEGSAYAIAHEALLSGWDTLHGWLGHDAEGRALRQRIERAAADWERHGKKAADTLWGDRLLGEVAGIEAQSLGAREAAFLSASRSAAGWRRFRRWAAALSVPLVMSISALGVAAKKAYDLGLLVGEVRQSLDSARAARDQQDSLRKDAFERFDQGTVGADEKWEVTLRKGVEVERAYADVCQRLEMVLQQDAGQKEARGLLADALYERAGLADRDGRTAGREDLVRRLKVYDPANRWDAPARLSIESAPPGADVALERYSIGEARWTAVPEAGLGTTPITDRLVAPGSIVLTFSLPGRATVRLPILLERGEPRRIALALPPAEAVPPGFVYVPPGRFLYGFLGDEEKRRSYNSQPLHPLDAQAFLIAQNETTYADWIAFLRTLPPDERIRRMPGIKGQGFTITLKELPGGDYQLSLGPEAQPYVARMGEPIRYPGRDHRSVQDWLRFPVSAISFEDVAAYAAWLDRSGKVIGARPCNELEWERAARGADSRPFPSGSRLAADDANHDVTYGRNPPAFGPDEVGSHPASDSPFGVHDLAGNVWEWVSAAGQPETPVGRGGSFFQGSSGARVENREPGVPAHRDAFFGLRICASPSSG